MVADDGVFKDPPTLALARWSAALFLAANSKQAGDLTLFLFYRPDLLSCMRKCACIGGSVPDLGFQPPL